MTGVRHVTDRAARRLLRDVLVRQRRALAASVAAGLVWQGCGIAVPWVLEQAIDGALGSRDRSALSRWCGVLLALGLVAWAADAARHWYVERAGAAGAIDLRRRSLARILTVPAGASADGPGDTGSRVVNDTWTVWLWLAGTATLVTSSFTLVVVALLLVRLDPYLAMIGLTAIPLAGAVAFATTRPHLSRADAAAHATGAHTAAVESAIAGARTVKGLGAEHEVLRRIERTNHALTRSSRRVARLEAWWVTWASAVPTAAMALGIWVGGTRVLDGEATIGVLLAFVGWMGQLVNATATLTQRLATRGEARAAARRLAELLADDPSNPAARAPAAPASRPSPGSPRRADRGVDGGARICARGLGVRHGEREVLSGVDLEVDAASWVALVGPTGEGKSSLLRVLAGLDRPTIGSVTVEPPGTMIGAGGIVHVPQRPMLVAGRVGEVMRLGLSDVGDDDVRRALAAVAADDVVTRLGGLGGVVTDRGHGLSGGQRQRLAVAAALLRRPSLLLLDDPTSALDTETERRMLAGIRDHLPRTTVIVATHRAAVATACEAVYEVSGGSLRPMPRRDPSVDAAVARGQS